MTVVKHLNMIIPLTIKAPSEDDVHLVEESCKQNIISSLKPRISTPTVSVTFQIPYSEPRKP